ncbi:MAG: fibrobacter succinogenes major paralogous domain-containing protein, partial [Paludibacter sp.]|nr:fibrobacter succinogenes major paralogous domain-containing protein [Paludibacter sp.]
MKTIGTLIIALILSCNLASAQDTLYIYRSGVVISQRPVSEIDSITFYRNYDIPVSETVTDIDGNTYHTVKIGTQTWMVENLKTTKYRNGDIIGTTTPSTKDISSESNPKYQWAFNGDESYVAKYGRLYTWYTINDDRKIAPNGWHVATDTEWIKLENYLIANGYNYDGSTVGNYESNNNFAKSLADIKDWNLYLSSGAIGNDLSKNNKTGFTALPAGNRSIYGVFYYLGLGGYWWTSTEYNDSWAWNRDMGYNVSYMGRHNYPNKQSGFSARCIKDSANSATFPTVTTNSVPFSLGSYSANIRGNVTSDGGTSITSRGLCWNTTGNPTILNNKISAGVGVGEFNCTITGLIPDSTYYVRAFATNSVGTAYGEQVSFKTLKTSEQTVTDIDGNTYHSVKIGTQIWMVENLKTTKYCDGNLIPNVTANYDWANLITPAYCWYNNDIQNKDSYGAMYNWYVVNSGKLCPKGWHIPSNAEWSILTDYLGGLSISAAKLREESNLHWIAFNDATNESGFTALPGGYRRYYDGEFFSKGSNCTFWSSGSNSNSEAWTRAMTLYDTTDLHDVQVISNNKNYGISVRCIKDNDTIPTLSTDTVTEITNNSAVCGGNISFDGGTLITARGICWSNNPNPTILNNKVEENSDKVTFISLMTGLMADST